MSEEIATRMPIFLKWIKQEIENTNSSYKLKGYAMAADMLFTLASQKYHRMLEKE